MSEHSPMRTPNRGAASTRRPVPDTMFGGRLRGAYLLDLEVVATAAIAPHVKLVTVGSSDLLGFEHEPGQDVMITFGENIRRRYTIRRADPLAGTMDFEFELHGGNGVAAAWAARAHVGDRLEAIGPRGTVGLATDATSHLFVGDDSAMPAIFAMLEAMPPGVSATSVLVSPHAPGSRPGPASDARLMWIDELTLADAITALTPRTAAYVFGERALVNRAVQLLAGETNGDRIVAKAYWRRDQPNAPHGEPLRG